MKSELNFREVGSRIQGFRLKNGLTQDELGEKIGTDQKYISRIEGGYHNISLDTVVAIARALHISVDSLVADYGNGDDESNLQDVLNAVRGMSSGQLDMLRDEIEIIKRYEVNG